MRSERVYLVVRIVRFLADEQPGIVMCELTTADGRHHTLIDKVPIFTTDSLEMTSEYPQRGTVRCMVLLVTTDAVGRELVTVSTRDPDGVESVEGLSEFTVLRNQILQPPTAMLYDAEDTEAV